MSWNLLAKLDIVCRPLDGWPGVPTPADERETSRFEASMSDTVGLLARELGHLDAARIVLQVDLRPAQIRLDGLPRSDAKASSPGVVLGFDSAKGPMRIPCDKFVASRWRRAGGDDWQHNLRAIALGLHDLRRLERYGIAPRGEQYRGWAELPAGIAQPATHMTTDDAARFIAEHAGHPHSWELLRDDTTKGRRVVARSYRMAAQRLHPDQGGDAALFQRLQAAKQLLDRGEAGHG